jgi:hypothetical protein
MQKEVKNEDTEQEQVQTKAEENKGFDHIPSIVEQIIENHIKEIGNKVVFLEFINGPRRRDGVYEIGSDIAQIMAHMEIQNY